MRLGCLQSPLAIGASLQKGLSRNNPGQSFLDDVLWYNHNRRWKSWGKQSIHTREKQNCGNLSAFLFGSLPCPCQHSDADLTPACPTAEYCVCRAAQAHPEGLPNPSACSTEFQKIPPMVHYFGKELRLRAKLSLLHFKIAGNGLDRLT